MLHRMPVARVRHLSQPPSRIVLAGAWKWRLILVLAGLAAIGTGLIVGSGLTRFSTRTDTIGSVEQGPWQLLIDAGTPAINPYLRAYFARTGQVPLAAAQGLTAVARRDSAGRRLDRNCTYRVTGPVPPALFWTLEAADAGGMPFETPTHRQSFTSEDVLRDSTGRFTIQVASRVQSGNWLPVTGAGPFLLLLRLYETPLSGAGLPISRDMAFPTVETLSCP